MKKLAVVYYPKALYKVEYELSEDERIHFTCYAITGLVPESILESDIDEDPSVFGTIRWDGRCEFKMDDVFFGSYMAENISELIKEIYKFKNGCLKSN